VWKPNIVTKALYSEALDRMVRLRISTAAIRLVSMRSPTLDCRKSLHDNGGHCHVISVFVQ
jgi:ribosomal protein L28